MSHSISGDATATAVHDAARAADAAGVVVHELPGVAEQAAAIDLLSSIWKRSADNPTVPPELLRALSKAGSYVGGAFAGERLVGVAIAFHADPDRRTLYSHIAGISPEHTGRAVGFALKLHQRAWALGRGIDTIEWTYDPLVSRNAYFNIVKLGAVPSEYLTNFYGVMSDGVNADDESDRLLVRWPLRSSEVERRAGGAPGGALSPRSSDRRVAVPADIVALRADAPDEARRWRTSVRDQLTGLFDEGYRIIGFDRGEGYVLRSQKEDS